MLNYILNHPPAIFVVSFVLQCTAAYLGDSLRRRTRLGEHADPKDFATILPAALTLLGLIIGFTFSMAVSRYDQRKTYEEAEANAIGTEYVRTDLLPAGQAAQLRQLLAKYVEQRVLFYEVRDDVRIQQINMDTAALQKALWSATTGPAMAQPTPISALVVSGMNDVLNSQGYTQAAWWNRVPIGAWILMGFVAIACNFLLGYSERHTRRVTLFVFPLILTIPFVLIADIDSPRGGIIRVVPQNLSTLSQSLPGTGQR
jgi:hypothetical protein